MASFQTLPGFRDFYPQDCRIRNYLFEVWHRASTQCGFSPYDGPPLEPLELYTAKSGEEIVHQLYNFTDKGERAVTLRPEMTPTLARMVGLRHRDFKKPIKWYSIPQVFRYERPQKGRLREHFQWNADIIGEAGLGAEAELIALIAHALKLLGFTAQDVVFRISDRMFWTDFLQRHRVQESQHYDFLQILDKIEREDPGVTRQKLGPLADEVLRILQEGASSARLDELLGKLEALGLREWVEVDLTIVRGLAYYTGTVFEVHDRKKELRALAGGGRYDHLLGQLSGSELPALGFGMGDVAITELLRAKKLLPQLQGGVDFFVLLAEESWRAQALSLVSFLREKGYAVDYALTETKLQKQLELAQDRHARYGLILDDHFRSSKLLLKNFATRTQSELGFSKTQEDFSFAEPLPLPAGAQK